MKAKVSLTVNTFLKSLIMFDLGLSVTVDGDWIFNDRVTGERVVIKRDDFIKAYKDMEAENDYI